MVFFTTFLVCNPQGTINIWDVYQQKVVRSVHAHLSRVSSLTWRGPILVSGSKDSTILVHDIRASSFSTLGQAHTQEVCGLKLCQEGNWLASGGNDNLLTIWEPMASRNPVHLLTQHRSAVKALSWCPWSVCSSSNLIPLMIPQRNLLASGGGSHDRCIRMWDAATGACLNCVDTKSQVTALQWSAEYREIVSAHG